MYNLKERTNQYINLPSPELDQAWRELLQYSNVRLTEAEVDAIDPTRKESSIPLPDGGYFGMLTVHHELHCVKHLHRFVYAKHYFGELTDDQLARRQLHMEHCLDLIRQSIMCHADVQPITMRWAQTVPVPGANYSVEHNCYNWDAVNNWAKGRSLDRIFEPGYLKHPTFGDVYSWEGLENLQKVGLAVDSHPGHEEKESPEMSG
ncbi:hypothetical protein QBC43DRAFT_344572 [Cladorrhinum sp. PSN259]|nr:hypothetical protein QBC43DRAFT_344572 [Cladorrhinum sp. PSN259]